VLFDQNTPRGLARHLIGHSVTRSAEVGWQRLKNGYLLRAAEASGFDLLLTCDRNLGYQQNVTGRAIGIVALSTNNWPLIRMHLAEIVSSVNESTVGSYRRVECGVFVKKRRKLNLSD
jgi:hypothetical protein